MVVLFRVSPTLSFPLEARDGNQMYGSQSLLVRCAKMQKEERHLQRSDHGPTEVFRHPQDTSHQVHKEDMGVHQSIQFTV
jgi:hypothetical protein